MIEYFFVFVQDFPVVRQAASMQEEQFMPYPKDRETELKPMTPLAK